MNKMTVIIAVALIAIISISAFALYSFSDPESSTTPSSTPEEITYVDAKGNTIVVSNNVTRIASLNMGITELICALDGEEMLVGRSAGCLYPPSVESVPIVGDSSYYPNVELIVEQNPEILFADTMLASSKKAELLQMIKDAGIKVIIEQPGNFTRLPGFIECIGTILNNEEGATETIEYITSYVDIVHERVESLAEEDKPLVYFEMTKAWRSATNTSVRHQYLVEAGGININADGEGSTVTPEFVATANPSIIIRMVSSDNNTLNDFEIPYNEIMATPQLSTVDAITNSEVYIYDSNIFTGLRYPVGLLYWAKWFNPELFADIDPAATHEELNQHFYGLSLDGVYAYP